MKKRTFDGGVASVRVIPMGMKEGGDLSVPPPKSDKPAPKQFTFSQEDILPRFEGFEPGPNQFSLPQEEKVIPSEPDVQPRTLDQRGDVGGYAVPDKPMSSEPFFDTDMGTLRPEVSFEERFFYGPVIRPQEVYPRDPDPGIMGIAPNRLPNGGAPNLLQAKDLKPAGILSINKVYDI